MPNIVRTLVFEPVDEAARRDRVTVIEFDVDDMTGEEIALAAQRLRDRHGVIDVSLGMRHGKKGRPLAEYRLLVDASATDEVERACFIETSTLGLRVRDERRRVLGRAELDTQVDGDRLRVKLAQRPDGTQTAKAAHDDLSPASGLAERRRTRLAAERIALEGEAP
jgi:uncharacterized protein (DUF111 family)